MTKVIVYTRPGGLVSVCNPSQTCLRFMRMGGGRWNNVIQFEPRGFLGRQIAEQAKHGVGERNAYRFVMALHRGGCTEAEAYEIMRDRYCSHLGTGCELWDVDEVPQDRSYRNAWRRSSNGGPIYLDETAVKAIDDEQIARMWKDFEHGTAA